MKQVYVPLEVRTRVTNKIKECIEAIAKRYGKVLPMPEVVYEKAGTTAGIGSYRDWRINLNSVLLMENLEDMIGNTVPHEFAHLATDRIYPEAHSTADKSFTRLRNGRIRRAKREVHGPRWREVMGAMGIPEHEITRLHTYDTTNAAKQVDRSTTDYVCLNCQAILQLSAKRHAMARNGTKKYTHTSCGGGKLITKSQHDNLLNKVQTGVLAPVQSQVLDTRELIKQEVTNRAPAAPQKIGPTGSSKIAICWGIYKSYRQMYDRQLMIRVFVQEANCTPAGAGTYYATCQKYWREGYV